MAPNLPTHVRICPAERLIYYDHVPSAWRADWEIVLDVLKELDDWTTLTNGLWKPKVVVIEYVSPAAKVKAP